MNLTATRPFRARNDGYHRPRDPHSRALSGDGGVIPPAHDIVLALSYLISVLRRWSSGCVLCWKRGRIKLSCLNSSSITSCGGVAVAKCGGLIVVFGASPLTSMETALGHPVRVY
ncbi:unnamed protein product [Mycena citricolor]|uniref:Uncharacterized protein n=1 Tax=Mycena citricolor TaxID=2018698 RepID=A0AAD2HFR3_9AGAR|nr:unnamed protein product [Mycena citricolor]